ncbi:hypothetical protein TKK_0005822 [Trichogramma kaykai]
MDLIKAYKSSSIASSQVTNDLISESQESLANFHISQPLDCSEFQLREVQVDQSAALDLHEAEVEIGVKSVRGHTSLARNKGEEYINRYGKKLLQEK